MFVKPRVSPSLIIKLIYLRRFFTYFIFFWSVDKIFFTQRGVNPFELSVLLVLWAAHEMIFEVPSGILADCWSRKWLLVISSFFYASAYFFWTFSHGFWTFLLGYLLRGTGGVLESGTREAFLYDHLKVQGKEEEYERVNGRIRVITTIAFLLTALVAGFLAERFSFVLVLFLSGLSNLIAAVVTFLIPDPPKAESTGEVSYLKFFREAWTKALQNSILLRAFIYIATVLVAYWTIDEYDQLYVNSLGLPLSLFGIWWLIRMTGEGLGGLMAHKFKRFNVQRVLTAIALANAAILFISGFSSSFVMLPVLGAMFGLFAIAEILNSGVIQKQIESHERATVTAIGTFFGGVIGMVASLAFGYVANTFNPRIGFAVFGGLILIYFVVWPLVNRNARFVRR